ncbi:hypothetical protein P0Y35_02870 [Kiritimatiellaeota bacterium B1221]|nr:hypothetical protein [Kiritimatiellaeota bacterium B1221]
MKKQTFITCVFGLSLLITPKVVADGLSVFGSYWNPSSGEDTTGIGLAVKGGSDVFYYELRGTFLEDVKEDVPLYQNEVQLVPLDFGIGLQADITQNLLVYGGGGFSYYFLDSDTADVDDEVGYYLQAGTELRLNERLALFGEAVWRDVEANLENDINLEDRNFDLKGMSVNLGLVYNW